MKLPVALVAASLLAGCSPSIKCDASGLIIMQEGRTEEQNTQWATANLQLSLRRLDVETNSPKAKWYTRESLEKAEGCP